MKLQDKSIFKFLISHVEYSDDEYVKVLSVIFKTKLADLLLYFIRYLPNRTFVYDNTELIHKFCIENKCTIFLQHMPKRVNIKKSEEFRDYKKKSMVFKKKYTVARSYIIKDNNNHHIYNMDMR